MTISAEEIATWIKRRIDQEQPLISLSPSMARDVVASLTDMKAEIERLKEELDSAVDGNSRLALILNEKRVEAKDSVTRIAALETQMAHGASGD